MRISRPDLTHAASLAEAEAHQDEIRELIRIEPLARTVHRVGGCDVAYSEDGSFGFAAAVALDLETLRRIETHTAQALVPFPYVPGLFAFREAPVLLEALKLLTEPPDVLLVEGHGIAHPNRAGLACHLGVVLDLPTIGCAKTPLGGTWHEPAHRAGAFSEIRMEGDLVGAAFRARPDASPVFISPGHRIDVDTAVRLTSQLFRDHRLPEPLHQAHEASIKARKKH
jgi:deoxyribonuclease V